MTTLVSLIGRSLPRSKRFIHTTAYALSAKPATDPPFINNNNNNNGTGGNAATGDDLTTKSKHASTKTTPFTKGRKQYRKSKRYIPSIPESFFANNCIEHAAIALEPIDPTYHFPDHIWQELKFSLQAGLAPKGALAAFDHSDHIILNIPRKGATYLQDKVARQLAGTMRADLIIFDSQDLIALAQENSSNAMTLLPTLTKGNPDISTILAIQPDNTKPILTTATDVNDVDQSHETSANSNGTEVWTMDITDNDSPTTLTQLLKDKDKLVAKAMNDIVGRYSSMFKNILQGQKLAKTTKAANAPSPLSETHTTPQSLANSAKIIYLRDYGEMHNTFGSLMLKALMMAVDDLRQTGQRLVVFGGHSPSLQPQQQQQSNSDSTASAFEGEEVADESTKQPTTDNYRYALQSDTVPLLNGMKCIHMTPPIATEQGDASTNTMADWELQMKQDAAQRIGELNARQLLVVHHHKQVLGIKFCNNNNNIHTNNNNASYHPFVQQLREHLSGINDELWSVDEVDRRVTVALGHALQESRDFVDIQDFVAANNIIEKGTSIYRQASELLASHRTLTLGKDGLVDLDVLKRTCNTYENRLVSRIVDPAKVQTSFKDVRAPISTIETLQTLISLPLQRPDLFQHGILKRNFISGVLLFGPPGTGKTMLAKAVAKESGSRMLEIQASDVYEMYVGEGEKNVKAIFSLARKLSPCVIFIDEVDSLMNRRQSEATSNAHREIINQFMVEWDGLSSNNSGVMVMAATNRPFDLDDAVLRRLPRRVLGKKKKELAGAKQSKIAYVLNVFLSLVIIVDLPKAEDRSEILKMLLKDEGLENEVSLMELAKATQHYSGSDLKNLCVTAALKSIQQQSSNNKNREQQLTRRLLQQGDFDEALKMVPASSSEDMDSLVEIRKWALKYGDGHQKKPKTSFGF
ncbi:hypothetical protein BCR42DRAFT_127445 [Absidia repens]|uniref:AAA+ ATPase domain-containing protein n=1 Tax=Absidia repens TaxID=90262 RepID=A0A1X2IVD2_9FUNG|nr:hypothetical protein BCR42DRAFT_127445 [Absidia repens]